MDAFWNFMTVAVTLGAALVPVAWAWHYDRYRKSLDAHDHWVSWIRALMDEVNHQVSSLKEMESAFQQMRDRHQFGGVTKRFNDDLFKSARAQVIQHPRSPHIFPLLTRTYRDTAHTNAMLDRFEASLLKNGGDWATDQVTHAIGSSVLGSLQGVGTTLNGMKKVLEEEEELFEVIRPRLYSAQ